MTIATTLSWAAPSSGSFNDAANWTPAVSPTGAFDTFIAVPGSYTVSVDAAAAAQSVTLSDAEATLAIGQTLRIGASLTVTAGIVEVNAGGTIQAGSVMLTGAGSQLEFTSAAIFGNTTLTIGGPAGTAQAFSTLGNFALFDNVTLTLAASLAIINGTDAEYYTGTNPHDEIDSETALAFDTPGDAGAIDGGGMFLNEGGISIGAGASLDIGDGISPMAFSNLAGVTIASGGSLTLNLGVTAAGTITFGPTGTIAPVGATLQIGASGTFGGTLANLGWNDIINPSTIVTSGMLSATQLVLTTSSGKLLSYKVAAPHYTGNLLLAPDSSGNGTDVIIPCFAAGSRIATADGDRPVESLAEGDLVRTVGGAVRPVMWVGRRWVDCADHADPDLVRPIRIRAHALGVGLPARDLLLSPDHAVFVDGLLIPVRLLVNHASIVVATNVRAVEYVHVELPAHDILLAEGLPAESYLDTGNRAPLQPTRAAACPASPEAARMRLSRSCAPMATDAARVEPIWRRIAAAAGGPGQAIATTTDPDLRLLHRGRSLRPITAADGRHLFAVAGGGTARLVSRASRPSDAQPWRDDRRRLGVRVSRIVARGVGATTLPLDDPALSTGWWEPDGAGDGRWTDGDAELPVAGGTMLLELTVRPLDLYRVETVGAAA